MHDNFTRLACAFIALDRLVNGLKNGMFAISIASEAVWMGFGAVSREST